MRCCLLLLFAILSGLPSGFVHGQGKSGKDVFLVRPAGDVLPLRKKEPQSGDLRGGTLTWEDFREVTIAQGSGRGGFNSLRIKRSGEVVAVHGKQDGKRKTWTGSVPESVLHELIAAFNEDGVSSIEGLYSAGVADGVQGFFEVSLHYGRAYAWMDNYFEPLEKSFAFCNESIWPILLKKKPVFGGTSADGQAEYRRIFVE